MNRARPSVLPAVLLIGLAGFAVRAGAFFWHGDSNTIEGGYTFYVGFADSWLKGEGLCDIAGRNCALRMPLYSLLVAALLSIGSLTPGLAVVQSAIGAAMVWPAFRLGQIWSGDRAGIVAAALTAFSPYAVLHDTALQDTVLANALVLTGLWLLVAASRRTPLSLWLLASGSAVLALATLTAARVGFVLPAALLWIVLRGRRRDDAGWRELTAVALPMVLLIGAWLARNTLIVGAPVLSTESGSSVWWGNSPVTMEYFPARSIDLAAAASMGVLNDVQQRGLVAVGEDEVAKDRLLGSWGWAYMREHGLETVWRMLRKIGVVAAAELSPARGPLMQVGYTVVYGSLQILAVIGAWRLRREWRDQLLVWLVMAGFLLTTAVYWAHTSHRSVIDPLVFVYAAGLLTGWRPQS